MLPNATVVRVEDGSVYIVYQSSDYINERVAHVGSFDQEVVEASWGILDQLDLEGRCVLDIGANMGTYSVPLARRYPGLRIYAFEPQRVVYNQLCGNLALNSLDNVWAYNAALGAVDASIDLAVPDYLKEKNVGGFSLDSLVRAQPDTPGYDAITQGAVESISVYSLDSLDLLETIALVKLDVEGFELAVLQGAVLTLQRSGYPPILFESWTQYPWWAERQRELWAYIESLGYTISEVCYNNYIAVHGGNS